MKGTVLKKFCLMGYLMVILFYMFLGFGRTARLDTFQFSFALTGVPLWFPKHFSLDILKIWVFSMGNLVAFIPFGVLIPVNLEGRQKIFVKSLSVFVISITLLEFLQMVTLLGRFDVEDIFVNTLGFLIGYLSWTFSRQASKRRDKMLRFCILCLILIMASIISADFINPLFR